MQIVGYEFVLGLLAAVLTVCGVMLRTAAVGALVAVLLAVSPANADHDPPRVLPDSGPWDAGSGFKFENKQKKTRRSLSGLACTGLAQRVCLAVFDEGVEGRYLTLRPDGYAVENERVVLADTIGELDAEAAATDGTFLYVAGSHSVKRDDCADNPDSRYVIRLRLDPATGRAARDADGKPVGVSNSGRLWEVMQEMPGLKEYVGEGKCLGTEPPKDAPSLLGQRGINIEGLAAREARLFFGLRGPAESGSARILAVDANTLFEEGGDPRPRLYTLTVGKGRGIRDMISVTDGILILAGPDDDAANAGAGWVMLHWDGIQSNEKNISIHPLASLALSEVQLRQCDSEIKPEAVEIINDEPGSPYELVILSDGMCDGGALRFTISR